MRRVTLAILARQYAVEDAPRGEVTLVVGPPRAAEIYVGRIDDLLDHALPFMPVKAASEIVAEALGIARKDVYERALAKKTDAD